MDWKLDLYHKVAPFIAKHALVASNTSGLSITTLSEGLLFERRNFQALFATEDQKEGMNAFLEKREPQFRDK